MDDALTYRKGRDVTNDCGGNRVCAAPYWVAEKEAVIWSVGYGEKWMTRASSGRREGGGAKVRPLRS